MKHNYLKLHLTSSCLRISGYTLLELLVAIVIAAIVSSIALGYHVQITRGYKNSSNYAEELRNAILVKKKMTAILKNIDNVESIQNGQIRFCKNDTVYTMRLQHSSIYLGSQAAITGVKSVTFSVEQIGTRAINLLSWSIQLENKNEIHGSLILQ